MNNPFVGKVYVGPAASETNPDAYLLIDTELGNKAVLRVGSKSRIDDLEALAEALNEWAKK